MTGACDVNKVRRESVAQQYKETCKPVADKIPPSPGHEREWLDCIKTRKQPSCSPEYHCRIDVPIVLSLLSYRLGRSIRFDPETESIVGDFGVRSSSYPLVCSRSAGGGLVWFLEEAMEHHAR